MYLQDCDYEPREDIGPDGFLCLEIADDDLAINNLGGSL